MSHIVRRFLAKLEESSLVRYLVSGGVTAVGYFAILIAATDGVGLAPVTGWLLAFGAAIPINYGLHKVLSFRSHRPHVTAVPRYIAALALNVALNASLIHLGTNVLGLHYLVPQIIVAPTLVLLNYFILRALVFPTDHDECVHELR